MTAPSPPAPSPGPESPGAVRVRVAALTDVGRTREHNEDAFLVADLSATEPLAQTGTADAAEPPREHAVQLPGRGVLFIVADGLGGAAAGEVASQMAVRTVFDALREGLPAPGAAAPEFAGALRDAVLAANGAIHQVAQRNADLRGMGTTITAALLDGDTLYLAQVGDSRAYVVRNGSARQITKDQSLMQRLLDAGEITPEQAETSTRRNIILQALGPEPTVKVDITHQPVRRGDVLLLCSDGLSGQVRAEGFAAATAESPDLAALCQRLVDAANAAGGPDNITVVAVHFDGSGLSHATAEDPVGHVAFPGMHTPVDGTAALGDDRGWATGETRRRDVEALLASGMAAAGAMERAESGLPPTVSPRELADRRDRARVAYLALAGLALLVALFWAWRVYGTR